MQTELNQLMKTLSSGARNRQRIGRWRHRAGGSPATALTGSHWTLEDSTGGAGIPCSAANALRHFLAEALMNTWKHAGMAAGEVELRQQQDEIVLGISDPGCGFDPATSGDHGTVGLHSLQHCARELGGSLELESQPEQGCPLALRFPCRTPDD